MANKNQRKVNKKIRLFNESFSKDIAPYNTYKIKQVKCVGRDLETIYLLHITKDNKVVASKWFEYYEIKGFHKNGVGRQFFWWVNDSIVKTK